MTISKLVCSAIAGALLATHAAHGQSQQDPAFKAVDAWAAKMDKIVQGELGPKRQQDMKDATKELNTALAAVKCEGRDHAISIGDRARGANRTKNLQLDTPMASFLPKCDGGKLVEATLSTDKNGLEQEDKEYAVALQSNQAISAAVSGWGSQTKVDIERVQPNVLLKTIESHTQSYVDQINKLKCHPKLAYDFKARVDEETKKRQLSITYGAAIACNSGVWTSYIHVSNVDFDATKKGENGFSSWTLVTRDMFPSASSFTSDSQKQSYAAKFASGGEYIRKLDTIACSDADRTVDFVKGEFAKKAQALKDVFKFGQPSFTCGNSHLTSSVSVEVVKVDPKKK